MKTEVRFEKSKKTKGGSLQHGFFIDTHKGRKHITHYKKITETTVAGEPKVTWMRSRDGVWFEKSFDPRSPVENKTRKEYIEHLVEKPLSADLDIKDLPMSLRTAASEEAYRMARLRGDLKQLHEEDLVVAFKHWGIIRNNFPYDSAYKQCDMLIPIRIVPTYSKLRWYERRELRKILDTYCQEHYDQVTENMAVRRSVLSIWHLHLLKFVDSRKEFKV